MRAGIGFDAHAFDDDRELVLGGVRLGRPGLAGHSDADVVSHSVADALLGAAALGDLGAHFPPDGRWRDASSLDLLAEVAGLLGRDGYSVGNVDVTVCAERPRLSEHRDEMVTRIAQALGVETSRVSVKATTTDGLGFVGRGEGIAAFAVALVERK